MNHKKNAMMILSTLCIILMITISMTTAYAVMIHNNHDMTENNNDATNSIYSWAGYDYNTETWLNMNDVDKKAFDFFTSLTDVDINDGNINLNDGDYEKYGSDKWVFNDENRFKVNMKNDKTSKGVVYINSIIYDNNMNTCSGSLIADNYVLTAAHCVTQASDSVNKPCPSGTDCVNGKYGDTSKFNERITLYVGRNSGHTDYGYYSAHKVYVPQAWRIDGLIHSKADIALIELNKDADGKYPTDYGASVYGYTWFDKFKYDFKNMNASFIGYPSDKWQTDRSMDGMWLSSDKIDNSDESFTSNNSGVSNNVKINPIDNFTYELDTCTGSSGAGLRYEQDGKLYIIGVNTEERLLNNEDNNRNIGVRIINSKYAWIRTIINEAKQ